MANRQLALANAALFDLACKSGSVAELKRSFRRHAVIRQRGNPRTNAVEGGWPSAAFAFLAGKSAAGS
jgi:hypothetical protein